MGVIACGSGPLDGAEERETLKLPRYNGMDRVFYMVSWTENPDSMTVKEYSAADLNRAEAEALSVTTYDEIFALDLTSDRVYEITAKWEEEKQGERGFYGDAAYVVVTE